jgi:adenosine deaminase
VKDFRSWADEYCPAVYPAITNQGEFLLSVLAQYLRSLREQNVVYAEIMLSSFTFQYDDIDEQLALYRQYRNVADAVGQGSLQTEFLIAIGRTRDRQKMERRFERILKVGQAGLVRGVAVAGLEEPNTIKPYSDMFQEWRKADLGIEIHAGEWEGPDLIWEALEYGHAQRIGHGLAAFADPLLVKHLRDHCIHMEFCPTSNTLLTRHNRMADHPIRNAIDEGISFSINTDDPGPFCTDITHEYQLCHEAFSLDEHDFEQICSNALAASFGSA